MEMAEPVRSYPSRGVESYIPFAIKYLSKYIFTLPDGVWSSIVIVFYPFTQLETQHMIPSLISPRLSNKNLQTETSLKKFHFKNIILLTQKILLKKNECKILLGTK